VPSTRDQTFDKVETLLDPTCEVIVVGPLSRTWFRDEGQYFEVLDYLHAFGVTPTVVGSKAFHLRVLEGASLVPGFRLKFAQGAGVEVAIGMASLCIAFSSRTDPVRFTDDEALQRAIVERKIPILVMDPAGDVSLR
jgi:hypothetical protein